jgi:hypothetical protein
MAMSEEFHWVSAASQPAAPVNDLKSIAPEPAAGAACCPLPCPGAACGDGACSNLGCDPCPNYGIVGSFGVDSFKGVSDGDYQSNFGAVTGLNAALPVPALRNYGIGWQLGLSYGVYDFDGRDSSYAHQDQCQEQIFVTTGFFHKAEGDHRLSFGLVYDWMINNNWGEYATAPTLGQWRGQIEYALSGCNAFGVWGCLRDLRSHQRTYDAYGFPIFVETRGVDQVNFFWHHKFDAGVFDAGTDSWLWVGFPDKGSLSGDGSLGNWMIGARVEVPLSERLALYANGSYFHPTAAAGAEASISSGFDVSMGITWYFGRNACSHSINGACGTPYMPVANNSTFLVDQFAR